MPMQTHFLGHHLRYGYLKSTVQSGTDCSIRMIEENRVCSEGILESVGDALPEIAREQQNDAYLSEVMRYLEQGALPDDERLPRRKFSPESASI